MILYALGEVGILSPTQTAVLWTLRLALHSKRVILPLADPGAARAAAKQWSICLGSWCSAMSPCVILSDLVAWGQFTDERFVDWRLG